MGWIDKYEDGGKLSPKQFTLDYIQSPKYKERLTSSGYSPEDEIKNRLSIPQGINTYRQYGAPTEQEKLQFNAEGRAYTSGGSSYLPKRNAIVVDEQQAEKYNINPNYIEAHELGHAELGSRGNINEETGIRESRLNPYDVEAITNRLKPDANKVYRTAPDEIKSDLNSLRYELYDKGLYDAGTEDFNEDILNKVDNSYIKNRLQKSYSDDDIIWLMNNIAKASQPSSGISAKNGTQLQSSKKLINFTNYNSSSNWLDKYSE